MGESVPSSLSYQNQVRRPSIKNLQPIETPKATITKKMNRYVSKENTPLEPGQNKLPRNTSKLISRTDASVSRRQTNVPHQIH